MKYIQACMFPNGEDLPLFSGIAQRYRLRPFAPQSRGHSEAAQAVLFEIEEDAEKHREDFYWLCPECEIEVHISHDQRPCCEVDDAT